jgi:hypothetical protein
MDALLNFAQGQTGSVLGFFGIAITYIVTACFDNPIGNKEKSVRFVFFGMGILFILLAIRCGFVGTKVGIDAGTVLAYLGIGTGLLCTAWAIRSHKKSYWFITVIGLIFELFGLILEFQGGLL